jgi:ferredoxin
MEIDDFCFYCGTCVNVCPWGAIELLDTGRAEINENCIRHTRKKSKCKICTKACPVGAIHGL